MRISRAIGRVKRQAKQGGLNAVIAGLGDGLRSSAVPRPLRGAAKKIADLLGAKKPAGRARKEPSRAHTTAHGVSHAVGSAKPPEKVTITGTDSGAEPNDEPRDDTPVDPAVVGATPTYNATPLEVSPVEVTAVDATPVDATPIEIIPLAELDTDAADDADSADDAEPKKAHAASSTKQKPAAPIKSAGHAKSQPKKSGGKNGANKKPASASKPAAGRASGEPTDKQSGKEKLAASGEAAKNLARSGSGAPKKRSGPRADSSSKKKS